MRSNKRKHRSKKKKSGSAATKQLEMRHFLGGKKVFKYMPHNTIQ
jgi:hypothetical protein